MRRAAALVVCLALLGAERSSRAEPTGTDARLSCRREPGPGRVLCELEVEAPTGRLAWADALVVRAPAFARPLRARVGPKSATGGTERRLRLPIALGATQNGKGELRVRARWVRCRASAGKRELCEPGSRLVSARVEVGAIEHEDR
jgi:hypothetical protein